MKTKKQVKRIMSKKEEDINDKLLIEMAEHEIKEWQDFIKMIKKNEKVQ